MTVGQLRAALAQMEDSATIGITTVRPPQAMMNHSTWLCDRVAVNPAAPPDPDYRPRVWIEIEGKDWQ